MEPLRNSSKRKVPEWERPSLLEATAEFLTMNNVVIMKNYFVWRHLWTKLSTNLSDRMTLNPVHSEKKIYIYKYQIKTLRICTATLIPKNQAGTPQFYQHLEMQIYLQQKIRQVRHKYISMVGQARHVHKNPYYHGAHPII